MASGLSLRAAAASSSSSMSMSSSSSSRIRYFFSTRMPSSTLTTRRRPNHGRNHGGFGGKLSSWREDGRRISRRRFAASSSTTTTETASSSRSGSTTDPSSSSTLSSAGKLFFGSLCAGTFALGCWQTQRLFEKQSMIKERSNELQSDPVTSLTSTHQQDSTAAALLLRPGSFRRLQLTGQFDHAREVLVGPRGAPPAGSTASGGSSSAYGANMPSPQGYYVVTPFVTTDGAVLLVNRGWVPRTMVVESPLSLQQQQQRRQGTEARTPVTAAQPGPTTRLNWTRPTGITTVHAVPSALEKPRFLVANHNYKERPIQFYWFDVDTMKQLVQRDDAVLVTSYQTTATSRNEKKDSTNSNLYEPVQPTLESLQEFKVSPPIHAAYAFTWFSLSLAGLIMTRRLATGGTSASAASAATKVVRP